MSFLLSRTKASTAIPMSTSENFPLDCSLLSWIFALSFYNRIFPINMSPYLSFPILTQTNTP